MGPGAGRLAILGGTGLTALEGLELTGTETVDTPWGQPSAPVTHGRLAGADVSFLPRHGAGHTIPPHGINYRANVWALKQLGIGQVVAVAAVGAIDPALAPSDLCVPRQIVDYTWGREHTFFDGGESGVTHVDFTEPYSAALRARVLAAAGDAGVPVVDDGVYGATQGPRLESAAEIDRMERDGCTLVGMTGMPEAALAREAGLAYAHLAVAVNAAAGRGEGEITMAEIEVNLVDGMARARRVLSALATLPAD